MQEIQKRKTKLESDLKEIIDRFHEENKGYEVYNVSVISEKVTTHAPKCTYQEIRHTKVTTDIHVL